MKNNRIFCCLVALLMVWQCIMVTVLAAEDDAAEETAEETTAETTGETTVPETFPVVEPPTILTGDASVSNGCHTLDAKFPLGAKEQLLDTAKSSILYELNSGTLLYAWKPDEPVYPASLVKIMTALLVVENGDLSRTVTVTESALSAVPYDAVSVSMKAGETFTMQDLLYCMMVASANDACAVAAEAIAGSQDAFVTMMNSRAKEIGCTGTNFVNAHGLHDEKQYTTARDMGKILEKALEYDQFRKAFGAASYTVPATSLSEKRELGSTNYFISDKYGVVKFYDKRVTGGKSGSISNSDRSMATTAESGGLNLMSVVMSAVGVAEPDGYSLSYLGNFEETTELLEYGFDNFEVDQILHEGKSVAQYPVVGGENHVVGRPVSTVSSALPVGTTEQRLVWKYYRDEGDLSAPIEAGTPIGMVQVWYGTMCLAQSDMVAMNGSKVAQNTLVQPEQRSTSKSDFNGGIVLTVLGVAFAVIIGIVLVLVMIHLVRTWIIRARRRRRRKNRRRSR